MSTPLYQAHSPYPAALQAKPAKVNYVATYYVGTG